MVRSGCVLILAFIAPLVARASDRAGDFDFRHLADAVTWCDVELKWTAAPRAPVLDESLGEYIARLSHIPREGRFYYAASVANPAVPFTALAKRQFARSADLRDLLAERIMVNASEDRLDIAHAEGGLLLREPLTEPIWRIQYQGERPGVGTLSIVGWSRTRHFRFENLRLRELVQTPANVTTTSTTEFARPLAHADQAAAEHERLVNHAQRPAPESLILEAAGEVAERLIASVEHRCRDDAFTARDDYPRSFLALAVNALHTDAGLRDLVVGAINEHVHGRVRVEALNEGRRILRLTPAACAGRSFTFEVPEDPFANPNGWGEVR